MVLSQLNAEPAICRAELDDNGRCGLELTEVKRDCSQAMSPRMRIEPTTTASHLGMFHEITGCSQALKAVLDDVRRVAPTDATVLIVGETGTGKELIARAIHRLSRRCHRALAPINCGAMPAGLIESELFGHEKGAFTGAAARHVGRFEAADGGTIFLDEVGELPASAQVKLLRFLQERTLDRVGGTSPVPIDVRVVAATNLDLSHEVREKAFRQDLYYRLSVFPIRLPPLRERIDDIPLLVRSFVAQAAARNGRHIEAIAPESMRRMTEYHWPGNIREMQNVLERTVILATGPVLQVDPASLGQFDSQASGPTEHSITADLKTVERNHIISVLRRQHWVIEGPRGAATVLGLHPNTLRHRIRKHGIIRDQA
jgi:transcriptional regulator with GAF, ATPase, and Fis domain